MLTAFLDTLDTSRLGLVVAAGLHPLAALDNCWAVQSCVTSMNPAHVYPDNLVLDLNEPEGTYRSTLARLFHNLGI